MTQAAGQPGQVFVMGGYTVGGATVDVLIFGHYEGDDLTYIARTRNGFTPRLSSGDHESIPHD